MKRVLPFVALFLFAFHVLAGDPQPVASTVREVTIFKSGAQITRTASKAVAVGRSELVFKGLSPNLSEKTVQLKAEGAVTIMSVRFSVNYLEENTRQADIQKIESELEVLNERVARLNNELALLQQDEALIAKNQVQVVGVQNNPSATKDLRELADYQRTRLKEISDRKYEIGQQQKELIKQADALRKQYTALKGQASVPSGELRVVLNAVTPVNAVFALSYYATSAGWEPVYDIRVKDVSSPVALYQKANLYQQTGEDWRDVKLSLSTGDPAENGNRPILSPWSLRYISPQARSRSQDIGGRYSIIGRGNPGELRGKVIDDNGEPLIGATISIPGTATGTVTDFNGDFVLKCPQGLSQVSVSYTGYNSTQVTGDLSGKVVQVILSSSQAMLQEVVVVGYATGRRQKKEEEKADEAGYYEPPVTVVELPTTLLYEIDLPVTLASDGQLQLVDIKDYELPATYQYYCAPKLDLNAYLGARVTGWESLGLLAGDASLFFEGTYLGKTRLEFANTSDTLDISLGRDKNISVTRTRLKEYSKRKFLSNRKEDSRLFEIAVKNKKKQTITLVLEDQFPISTNKNITVDRDETGKAAVDDTTGQLSWVLQLAPAEDKKVRFGYTVKYPKERLLSVD